MALFPEPFNTLLGLQEALEAFRTSSWLESGPSGSGSDLPLNVFRKGDDFVLITEVPGINKSDLDVQLKGRTIRAVRHQSLYTEYNVGHCGSGFTLSGKIDRDGISAQLDDGVLTLTLPKAKEAMPRQIAVN